MMRRDNRCQWCGTSRLTANIYHNIPYAKQSQAIATTHSTRPPTQIDADGCFVTAGNRVQRTWSCPYQTGQVAG
jgi:hypothetical protein